MGPLLVLKVSLLLSVTLVAARLLNRAPATARHGLWSLAFGSLLLLAPLAALLPALHVPVPAGWESAAPAREISPIVSASAAQLQRSTDVSASKPTEVISLDGPQASSQTPVRASRWPSASTLLFAAWLTGMIAAVATVLVSLFRVQRLVRTAEVVADDEWRSAAAAIGVQLGVRHPVRLLVSPHVSTPMAGGVWRPAIFLPRSASLWSSEHRDLVLAHELAHLARLDPLRHLMTRFALACYWFHPLAWLAAREAAIAREQACDETVLAMGARRSAYARVLLDLAESMSAQPRVRLLGALPMVHRSHLERRLMAILNGDVRPTTRRLLLGPAIGIALLTLSVAAAQPFAQGVAVGQVQGTPVGVVAGTPAGVVQGTPVPAAVRGRFAEEQARPFAETFARPFAELQARPFAETYARPFAEALAKSFAGSPATTEVQAAPGRDSTCWSDRGLGSGWTGSVSGSKSSDQSGGRNTVTDQMAWRDGDRIIQRTIGDLRLCMVAEGVGDRNNVERPSQWIGRARRVVMEAHRGNTVQRLEFNGTTPSWQVGGATRDFDAAAQTWRDRMLAVLDITWEVSSLRGEVSGLRGQISAIEGQHSALQGEISALQGEVSAMQGRISSVQGEESRLRGEISSIRGHVSALQGRISAERSAISRLQASPRVFTPIDPTQLMVDMSIAQRERNRIATEIADHEAAIERIQRQIRDYGAEKRIAAVQKEIDSFDANVSSIERQIRNFDLGGKVAAVERRIAALSVEGKVGDIERQIDALDAERRAKQLNDRLDAELPRLTAAISAIR